MQKMIVSASLSLCILCSPVFANKCMDTINAHVYNQGSMLYLEGCNLNDDDMQAVSDFVKNNPAISEIVLDDNNISGIGVSAIASLESIDTLSISNNKLGQYGAYMVASMPNLQTLIIEDNHIGDAGAKALSQNKTISQLVMGNNNLTGEGLAAIAAHPVVWNLGVRGSSFNKAAITAITNNKNLRWLDLRNSNLSTDEVTALVSRAPLLEQLDVSENPVGNRGAVAIAQKSKITTLFMNGCAIGDEGAIAIAKMPDLFSIDLEKNNITDEGARAFAKSKISFIDLSDNHLGDAGASAFANSKIDDLFIEHNYKITNESAFALAKNTSLKYLNVRFNHIEQDGVDALHQSAIGEVDTEGNIPAYLSRKAPSPVVNTKVHVLRNKAEKYSFAAEHKRK